MFYLVPVKPQEECISVGGYTWCELRHLVIIFFVIVESEDLSDGIGEVRSVPGPLRDALPVDEDVTAPETNIDNL